MPFCGRRSFHLLCDDDICLSHKRYPESNNAFPLGALAWRGFIELSCLCVLYGRSTDFCVKGLCMGGFDLDDGGGERVCVGADRGVGSRWRMRRGGMGGDLERERGAEGKGKGAMGRDCQESSSWPETSAQHA